MSSAVAPFQDRELVKLLRDEPELLAIADALVETHRSEPTGPLRAGRRTLRWSALLVAAALAASLIGVFAFGQNARPMQPGLNEGLGTQGPNSREGIVGPVLPPPPRSIAITDLSLALGQPVALPDTPLVQPSDAQSATAGSGCPAITPKFDGTCSVVVKFPSQSLTVEYDSPTGQPGPSGFAADIQTMQQEAAAHPGSGRAALLDLNGVPAMFSTGDYSLGAEGSASIHFIVGETAITISGDQSEASLQALAQSILDQMPAPQQVTTTDASTTLGAAVVLPNSPLVQPSDAAPTSTAYCPSQPTTETPCQVTVAFPSLAVDYVPLSVRYLRPGAADPDPSYASVAKQVAGAKVLSLGGVPALFLPGPNAAQPSSIEFVSNGTDITVLGIYDETTLQATAQSIIDQTG